MALLHAARVLAALNKEEARQVFSRGAASAESLPLDSHQRELVLSEAVRLGSTADPLGATAFFRRLPVSRHPFGHSSTGAMLVQSLAQCGEIETALSLLEDPNCDVSGAAAVVHHAPDLGSQRRAMAAEHERWRAHRKKPDAQRHPFRENDFFQLFSTHWRKLERPQAEEWLAEALLSIETEPYRGTKAEFGDKVELHSMQDMNLFYILNVVRALREPDQVESILGAHPDVATASKVYPLGVESLMAEKPPTPRGSSGGFTFAGSGSGRDARMIKTVISAMQGDSSAVQHLFNEARETYKEDTDPSNPNTAPRAFWPSCHAYKVAMYWAGKTLKEDAKPLLAEIPDPDLALLASIEMAAGALGIPEHWGVRMGGRSL